MRRLILSCVGIVGLFSVVIGCGKGCRQTPVPPESSAPAPTVILAQAWFTKDAEGKPKPGPARLEFWRQTPEGWRSARVEDPDSNVFHKVLLREGGLVTIGAEQAMLKRWRMTGEQWTSETIWKRKWGGRFNRLRDIEVGDVDGDGRDEYVIATHDSGVVAVVDPPEAGKAARVIELDEQPDTFVHEIEIGDVDGDGKLEFFATPSARNKVGVSQRGQVVMYRWNGAEYKKSIVDPLQGTHAKEILVVDLEKDGRDDLLGVAEAELGEGGRIVRPVEIRRYSPKKGGGFDSRTLATIDDAQCRFLVSGDFDRDGKIELVAAALRAGLFLLDSVQDGQWTVTRFEGQSSGYEHATLAADLDGDGTPELYVAADDQGALDRYVWNATTKAFDKTHLAPLEKAVITWNLAAGRL